MQIYTKILIGMAVGVAISISRDPIFVLGQRCLSVYGIDKYEWRLMTAGDRPCAADAVEMKQPKPFDNCRVALNLPAGVTVGVVRASVKTQEVEGARVCPIQ